MSTTYEIDHRRTAALTNGWRVAVCVGPDGDEMCWLLSPTPQQVYGCACRSCAPHDQLWVARKWTADTSNGTNA